MSLASALIRGHEARSVGGDWDRYVKAVLGQMKSSSGVVVSPETAMKLGVFFDCVRIIAEDCAKLPLFLYRRLPGGGKEKALDHPIYRLLRIQPNPYNTSMELRETVVGHMVSRGNGYLYKRFKGGTYPESLWPLRPDRIVYRELSDTNPGGLSIDPDADALDPEAEPLRFYEYILPSGQIRNFPARDVIHFRGFGFSGRTGYNPAFQAKQSIGLTEAAERYAGVFFANDATPRIVLKHKKHFQKPEAAAAIRKSWEERMRGLDRSHLVAILEDDMDVETIGVNAEEAQLLATREYNVEDVARWFRMPPHKVGALRKATYSNIEHQSLEYVVDTLTPPLTRVEQRLTIGLLTQEELGEYFIEHLIAGLLRGDFEARMKGYRVGREIGMYSVNDLLEIDNRNPIGPEGDVRHIPLNWVILTTEPEPDDDETTSAPQDSDDDTQNSAPQDSDDDDRTAALLRTLESRRTAGQDRAALIRLRLRAQYQPLFRQAADLVAARENADVARAVRRYLKKDDAAGLRAWVETFYDKHRAFIREKLAPVLESYAEALAGVVTDHLGEDLVNLELLAAFQADYLAGKNGRAGYYAQAGAAAVWAILERHGDDLAAIEAALDDIRAKRPDAWADREAVRAGEALVREAYGHAGVITFRWRSGRDDCPFAGALTNQIRMDGQPFINSGQSFEADGETLQPSSDINHAPAHRGCVCYTEPVLQGDQ